MAYALKPSGGQAAIQIPSEILRVALKKTSTSDEQALRPITMEEYRAIANKAQTGTPTMWAYKKRLVQGTLYVDMIESGKGVGGHAHVIKSHHNVGGLPERMDLALVEPVRELWQAALQLPMAARSCCGVGRVRMIFSSGRSRPL